VLQLIKRPLVFMDGIDRYMLKSGADGADAAGFDAIGTADEVAPLVLADLQSCVDTFVLGASSGGCCDVPPFPRGAVPTKHVHSTLAFQSRCPPRVTFPE
jgi:hypothetical protein